MKVKGRRETQKKTLNRSVVAALPIPAEGRVYWHDDRVPGLSVCVTSAGSKTYYLYRWANGRPLRQRLGTVEELTVEQARDIVRGLTGEIAQGVDVQARRRQAREEPTVGEVFAHWMEYAKAHKRTWHQDERRYNRHLVHWASRRLSTIKPSDIERLHYAVRDGSGLYQANRVLELVRSLFRRAGELRIWSGDNPGVGVKRFKETSRERFLSADELARFFAALDDAPGQARDFFSLLLFTGQRRGATQAMRWGEIDLVAGTWLVPPTDSKNKRSIMVHLVPEAVAILERRQHERGDSPFVFATCSKTGHLVQPTKTWENVITAAKLPGVRIHDLRRTVGSWLASRGVSLPIIGAVLGHAPGSKATNVYARLMPSAVKASVASVASDIAAAGKVQHGKAKTK